MSDFTVAWLDVAARSSGILVLVLFASWILRRLSAATRHAVCVAGMISLLLLPVAAAVIPAWRVLPHWRASHDVLRKAVGDGSAAAPLLNPAASQDAAVTGLLNGTEPHRPDAPPEQAAAQPAVHREAGFDKQSHSEAGGIERRFIAQQPVAEQARDQASARRTSLVTALFIVLSAGSVVCGSRLVISLFWLRRLSRTASTVTGELRDAFNMLQRQMGVTRPVRCRLIADATIPMAWGVVRPELLLPDLMVDWPHDRRNAVLLHELGHIARHDPLWQFVTELASLVYWFHPLYWIARRHGAVLRERSCDDIVLNHGISSESYASALVAVISSTSRARSPGPAAVAMSATSQLTGRIQYVMDARRNRQPVQTFAAATMGVLSALMMVPLAVLHAAEPSPPETTDYARQEGNQPNEEANIDLANLTNEQLLARFERAPFGSAMVMTGGGGEMFVRSIGDVCRYAAIWETQHLQTMEQDVTVRAMIRRGDAILPDIHDRITHGQLPQYIDHPLSTWASADLYGAYAYVAGQIGNRETVTDLIQLFREARMATAGFSIGKDKAAPRMGMFSSNTTFVVTHALWQLTGRRHAFSADEWEQYLAIFGDEFVPARERSDHVPDPAAVEQHVRRLVSNPFESREWLIAQDPAIVPQLLRALNDATEDHAIQIAWVIDELGATQRLRPELRRRYFNHRLSQLSGTTTDELAPLDDLARRRALEHLPFADFVEIALEVNEQLPDALGVSMSGWLSFRASYRLQVKFGTASVSESERNAPNAPWAGITPLEDPASEIEAAVPGLVDAIASGDKRRRELGIRFAEKLSLYSASKPAALIEALRECWTENLDANAGRIMAQFGTPAATQAVLDGLQANDLTLLSQAVSFVDELRLTPAEHPDVFLQLVEYTRYPLQPLRRYAVQSLRRRAPELLYSELDRLSRDPDQRIREECIHVLRRRPNRLFVDILFDMANDLDEDKDLRRNAVSALGDPEYRDHVDRMLPLLDDDDLQGYVCSAISDAAGSDALAIFYRILQRGDDCDGFMYQYLERLTGAKPEQTVDAWQKWFAANPDMIPVGYQ